MHSTHGPWAPHARHTAPRLAASALLAEPRRRRSITASASPRSLATPPDARPRDYTPASGCPRQAVRASHGVLCGRGGRTPLPAAPGRRQDDGGGPAGRRRGPTCISKSSQILSASRVSFAASAFCSSSRARSAAPASSSILGLPRCALPAAAGVRLSKFVEPCTWRARQTRRLQRPGGGGCGGGAAG